MRQRLKDWYEKNSLVPAFVLLIAATIGYAPLTLIVVLLVFGVMFNYIIK